MGITSTFFYITVIILLSAGLGLAIFYIVNKANDNKYDYVYRYVNNYIPDYLSPYFYWTDTGLHNRTTTTAPTLATTTTTTAPTLATTTTAPAPEPEPETTDPFQDLMQDSYPTPDITDADVLSNTLDNDIIKTMNQPLTLSSCNVDGLLTFDGQVPQPWSSTTSAPAELSPTQ